MHLFIASGQATEGDRTKDETSDSHKNLMRIYFF